MKYQYSFLLFICLFGIITPRVFAQIPCNQRLITNADFSYTGGGTAPARWDVPQANAGGFSIDPAAYTYTASGNFSNQNVDWFNANSNLNNTAQYAIAQNPKDLSPQYADIPTDGMIVINPKQNQDAQYSQFQINNLLPLQTYYVEIKIYNVIALTSRASDNNCHSWCNWNSEINIKWEGNGNNAHDGQSNLTWTGSNGSNTSSGSWDAWGNQNSNMMWVAPGGAYAILKGQMTLGNATSGFTFTFSKKAETNPMVLGIDYIKIYGCQQEAINISGGSTSICEASPFTLTAQGIGAPGSTYQWYQNNVLLPGRTSDTLNIVSATSPGVQTIYKAVGEWDTKSDTLVSRLCCSSVNGTSDEMLRESFNGLTYSACGAYGPYADIPAKNVTNFIDPTYTYPSSTTRCDLFDGQYAVVKSSYAGSYWKSPLAEVKDHTGVAGSGALFVNAKGLKGSIFFSRNLPGLCPSTTYEFSIWYASIAHVGEVEPNMEFDIMNGATVVASTTTGIITVQDHQKWKEATVTFTTPPSNVPTYTLQVINLVQSANGPPLYAVNGNDLMLDDIVVKKCTPGINVYQNGTTDSIVSVCDNNPVAIKVNTFYDLPLAITGSSSGTVYYQWMSSTSPTGPWALLGTPETTGTFSATPTATPTYYRAKVSADQTRAANGQIPLASDCGNDAMTYSFKLTKGGNFSIPPASGTTAYCVGDVMALNGNAGTGVQWEWRKGTTFGGATVLTGYAYSSDVTKKNYTKTFATGDEGTYYFVVKDAGGCETYDDIVVTANPVLTITPAAKAGDVCLKTTSQTTTLTYTATGAPTNYTITWDPAGITAGLVNVASTALPASPISITVPANTSVGTYTGTIKVTKTNGCPSTGTTFTLTVNAPTTPTFTAIPAVCQGGTAPTLPATSTNSINGTWSPATVNTATVGTVTYNFTPAAGQCAAAGTLSVTVTSPSTVPTFNTIPNVCQGTTAPTLPTTSTNNITGTWSPATVSTATVGTTTYNFTPSTGQCAAAGTLSVTVTSPSTVPTFNNIPNVCQGASAPTLPTTSTNNITGTWSPATVSTATVGTTTYNFTPAVGQCAVAGTLSVTVIAPTITPSFTPIANLCRGATAPTLPTTSNNSITGTWNPAIVSTATAGTTTYNFTPTAGQCANPTSLSVTIDAPTTPLFTPIGSLCTGSAPPTLPTTSDNNITGTWNPATVSTASAGTTSYTFTPTAGQCATTANMSITVASSITPNFAPIATVCVGATPPTLPTTSTNNITGTWNPATVSTATAGTTSYTFTPDAGQCASATSSVPVTVTSPVTPNFAALAAVCQGATAPTLPTTSIDGITGTWSPAVSTATVGTASYTFTPNPGQCATTTTASLTVTAPTIPGFNAMPAVCQGATAPTLPVSSTQGITGTWSPTTVSTATVGTTSYTFTPNAGQCAASTTLPVTVTSPSTVPNFAPIPSICQGTTAPILPTTSTDGISGTWSPAVSTATVGTSTYTFTPNAGQCAATTTASVTVTAPSIAPTFNTVPSVCVNSTPPVLPTVSTNNISGTWLPAVSTATIGTSTYTFTPNAGQCAITTTASVTVTAPTITPTFNPVLPVCVNSTPPVLPTVSTNNISGAWSPAVSTTTVGTTSYTFTPNAGQCATTNTLSLTVTSPPPPTVSNVQYCQNDVALPLSATGSNLTWYTLGGSTSVAPTPSTAVPRSTNYSVSSSDGTCESAKIPFVVTVKPITANAGGPIIRVEEGKPFQINGSATGNGMIVSWSPSIYLSSPSIPNPVITAFDDRTYKMTVRTNDGCSASDDLEVIVLRTVEIPNAFSPNGDGINDTWQIKYLEDYTAATVSVFNRYGQFLFESPAGGYGAKPWDGTNKGAQVPVGTYFYIIKLGPGKTPLSGSVSVIR